MADRVEREIEEILARLDKELPAEPVGVAPERKPISISSARDVRAQKAKVTASSPARSSRINLPFEPPTLLFAGAGIMIAGLILSTAIASAFIWLSFGGVLLFLAAFGWSFFRTKPENKGNDVYYSSEPGKVFWRDRYIDARPGGTSTTDKIRRRFRR